MPINFPIEKLLVTRSRSNTSGERDLDGDGLILIDETESPLHPRAQRRLVRDLARACRLVECQIILTTHSPYVLEELPLAARSYILESAGSKEIVSGVSPQFAMTKMDDELHPECELYVEDPRAKTWLREILSRHAKELSALCREWAEGAGIEQVQDVIDAVAEALQG